MGKETKVTVGEVVCFWLVYGQPYLAKVDKVYEDQINAAGGPTVDLTYAGAGLQHVTYDPAGQPRSYCRVGDPGWAGTLAIPLVAEPEPQGQTVAGTATKRTEPK